MGSQVPADAAATRDAASVRQRAQRAASDGRNGRRTCQTLHNAAAVCSGVCGRERCARASIRVRRRASTLVSGRLWNHTAALRRLRRAPRTGCGLLRPFLLACCLQLALRLGRLRLSRLRIGHLRFRRATSLRPRACTYARAHRAHTLSRAGGPGARSRPRAARPTYGMPRPSRSRPTARRGGSSSGRRRRAARAADGSPRRRARCSLPRRGLRAAQPRRCPPLGARPLRRGLLRSARRAAAALKPAERRAARLASGQPRRASALGLGRRPAEDAAIANSLLKPFVSKCKLSKA